MIPIISKVKSIILYYDIIWYHNYHIKVNNIMHDIPGDGGWKTPTVGHLLSYSFKNSWKNDDQALWDLSAPLFLAWQPQSSQYLQWWKHIMMAIQLRIGCCQSPLRTLPLQWMTWCFCMLVAPLWCDLGCCFQTDVVLKLLRTPTFSISKAMHLPFSMQLHFRLTQVTRLR